MECGECGCSFKLSVRRAFEYRREGRAPRCAMCRRPQVTMTTAERRRYCRWWLGESGLSRVELREIAAGLSA